MPTRAPDAAHLAEVEAWREARYARLREPMSWLTLVGLEWLREGENRVGADPEAELRLPSGPPVAATLVRDGSTVVATAHPGGGLRHDGREVDRLELVADVDAAPGEGPTLLEVGALRMCLIRRGEHGDRLGLRVWDTDSTARDTFERIPHYPVDPAWRVVARFEPAPPGVTVALPDVLGDVEREALRGSVAFEVPGDTRTHRLQAVDGGGGRLWLIFGDATNGDSTYGGGRFLYTDPPAADATVVVDFNRAYNPPCVFSPYATCPLPTPENRLPIRIEAGELVFGDAASH